MQEQQYERPDAAIPGGIVRREFLKLGVAGLAGTAIVGSGLTGTRRALAQGSGAGPLRREFEAASEEYGVPVEVLLAMGYVNTRWEMPEPGTNAYEQGAVAGKGTYGIMALVQNPTTDSLGDAAALTGIPEARLKTERAANIRGGAALLADASGADTTGATEDFTDTVTGAAGDLDATDPAAVEDFNGTVSGAAEDLTRSLEAVRDGLNGGSAVAGVGGGELYAEQVRETMQSGVSETISSGERVSLAPASQEVG